MPLLSLFHINVLKMYMSACPLKPLTLQFSKIFKFSCWVIFKVGLVLRCHQQWAVMLKFWRNLLAPSSWLSEKDENVVGMG
jgi:hypothetical protein